MTAAREYEVEYRTQEKELFLPSIFNSVIFSDNQMEDSKKRALEAVQRRCASEARAQQLPQIRDKRIRHNQTPDPETECPTFSRISQPVHENLLTVVAVSNTNKSVVDKLLHDLLRKGDSAQKYIQGSRSVKADYQMNLDNYIKKISNTSAHLQALQANSKRSKKHMSLKQLKKIGLFNLPEESQKYELFVAMHEMWKEYVLRLLKNTGKNQIAAVLFGANLHGAILRVIDCKVVSFIGVLGIMIRETAQTFGIITQDNKFRVVPKRNSVFVLQADCWRITLHGDKFISRKLGS